MSDSQSEQLADVGLIGLAVMGENLVLNMADRGFRVAVHNRTTSRIGEFLARNPGHELIGGETLEAFVAAIKQPRRIILLIKSGPPVDQQMEQLRPHLEPGDLVIDGGNSYFTDTQRRVEEYAKHGLLFMGMGVSGGEEGARHGPSIMPGGSRKAYEMIEPIVTKIAAQVDDGPCVTFIGKGGAGHYVKMVHNGIEYADMQLIAEAYDVLRRIGGLDAADLASVFSEWNEGVLQSYLIEITADIFRKKDPDTGRPLVEMILDAARQKGTGKWTSQNALDLGVPVTSISAAVDARYISAQKEARVHAASILPAPEEQPETPDRDALVKWVHDALYTAKICSYAQGMALLQAADSEYGFELNLSEISRIWKGGCIIRARLLDQIQRAFARDPKLDNLLLDEWFRQEIGCCHAALRKIASLALRAGIPAPGFCSALAYYDSYRSERLPANLVQAQRDYFGAHTYERIDRAGVFHTDWVSE